MEETIAERGGCLWSTFLYLQFIFYYLEEAMDHKILIPPHLGNQYEIYESKNTFQNILGFAGRWYLFPLHLL